MNIIDLATKTMQTATQTAIAGVKSVVDDIKSVVDVTKSKVDSTATKVDSIDIKVGTLLDGRVVKSVQRGSRMVAAGTPSANVAISAVTLSKSLLIFSEKTTSTNYVPTTGKLAASNLITFVRDGYVTDTTIEWQVIEFY